jgi:hypothetical protein
LVTFSAVLQHDWTCALLDLEGNPAITAASYRSDLPKSFGNSGLTSVAGIVADLVCRFADMIGGPLRVVSATM